MAAGLYELINNINKQVKTICCKIDQGSGGGGGGVPLSRNLTFNGVTQDLSSDRTWTINSLLTALPFTTDHINANGNQYVIGDVVYYNGNIYRCIASNDSILPTSTLYWTNLGVGNPVVQQPINWNSTSGNNQILNKPAISISTQGTSLYSTNPATSGFSTNDGIFLGVDAGFNASAASNSNFMGFEAGKNASNAYNSNFFGKQAGKDVTQGYESNFIGAEAGAFATNISYCNFLGNFAGRVANFADAANFIGLGAGAVASDTSSSNFIGREAGAQTINCGNSNFIGSYAGKFSVNAGGCNFIGNQAGFNSTGFNVIAIGTSAGNGNAMSGMTIISNSSLPSYTDRSAATTAITIGNGAVAGNTYLYYNQTTFAIEGVRL
jgi:hypothetical protein